MVEGVGGGGSPGTDVVAWYSHCRTRTSVGSREEGGAWAVLARRRGVRDGSSGADDDQRFAADDGGGAVLWTLALDEQVRYRKAVLEFRTSAARALSHVQTGAVAIPGLSGVGRAGKSRRYSYKPSRVPRLWPHPIPPSPVVWQSTEGALVGRSVPLPLIRKAHTLQRRRLSSARDPAPGPFTPPTDTDDHPELG
ncbi:hypothetical protein PUNSTDRAFT_135638 [Punctularia strigosozonata HHB-11173 SS5]|uniref:uncharacterized protein n=1 Tax=Punctularia strigosozonata (strain HHB-11173) TaxID=741275 RepID=UPI000441846B|nr:uncharacterized protein PUNSTDRAFT_135638 [Punctularia strigosozonata HHB-11173 SS5]EIN06936.1 hypothetical protein PUNSTDRAFT_135638 [Punctularia strigosozonata HHB-11173 SS5]